MEGGRGRTGRVTALKILHDSHDVAHMGDDDDGGGGNRFDEFYMKMVEMMIMNGHFRHGSGRGAS